MAKVVVENVNVEKKKEIASMIVGKEEMKKIVAKLPNWGKEVRRIMAERFRGYKYWTEGIRLDEQYCMMKKDGNRQWFLKYLHYRICGKGKRTLFRTIMMNAYFIDSNGRTGCYENNIDYCLESKINGIKVVYRSLNYHSNYPLPIEEGDMIDALKYSNIEKIFSRYTQYDIKKIYNLTDMYLHFPQIEFIYKIEDEDNQLYILSKLLDLYNQTEYDELKDWINIIKLSIKHKILTNIPIPHIWWEYVVGIKKLEMDWRNPHYLFPKDIWSAYRDVMKKLGKKYPEPVPNRIKTKFKSLKQRFVGLKFREGDLSIRTLYSPEEYIEESKEMHNCIAKHEYYIKPSSLILCATLKGKRLADIELSLENYEIIQCYGPCNGYVKERAEIEALIKKNIPEIIVRQFAGNEKDSRDKAA